MLFEFADSQLSRAEPAGADLRIVLSAAHVRSATAGTAGEGYLSSLVLWFRDARWSGELDYALGRVAAGELRADGQTLRALPLPFEAAGPVQCHLSLANGTVLDIMAASMYCPLDGNEAFVESYAC